MTPEQLEAKRQQHSDVRCGSCTACCKSDRVMLGPEDDLSAYRWHMEGPLVVLDRKNNGECVYLTPKGCGIHGKAPDICKRFDCRVLFLITPKVQRRIRIEQNPSMREVYAAGRSRLNTLEA